MDFPLSISSTAVKPIMARAELRLGHSIYTRFERVYNLLLSTYMKTLVALSLLVAFSLVSFAADLKTGVATTGVNFRSSPNGQILRGIGKGEFFEILSNQGAWTHVRLASGRKGYIFSKYVTDRKPQVPDTEGGFCENCHKKKETARLNIKLAEDVHTAANAGGAGGQCVARKMVDGARKVHRSVYGGRARGKGKCGKAVRQALNSAGIWSGGGIGHARDMVPGLKRMGFINIKTANMTPDNAPSGTILVYGRALKGAKGCRGLGTTYGHVEIKESRNSFLYDGNPSVDIQKAYGPQCRPLIGVMQMGTSCPTCSVSVKRACGV